MFSEGEKKGGKGVRRKKGCKESGKAGVKDEEREGGVGMRERSTEGVRYRKDGKEILR